MLHLFSWSAWSIMLMPWTKAVRNEAYTALRRSSKNPFFSSTERSHLSIGKWPPNVSLTLFRSLRNADAIRILCASESVGAGTCSRIASSEDQI